MSEAAHIDWEAQLKLLQTLNAQMLEQAQLGAWETVSDREMQRRTVIEQLFQAPPPPQWLDPLKDAIQATLMSDSRVQELAGSERDKVGDKLRSIRQGRRALSAYDQP